MEKVEQGFGFVELLEDNNMDVVGLLNLEEKKENNYNMFLELPPPLLPSSCYTRMVCFGGEDMFVGGLKGSTCGGSETSSSTSSSSSNNAIPKAKGRGGRLGLGTNNSTANGSKKPRKGQQNINGSINGGATKVRKEKLGDRIVALQQLVSPFGKSDTASVLHEAMCYIKFLHDQVQVLSSPYLQQQPTSESAPPQGSNGEESRMELRRRGLCLVPISSTVHVAGTNGADLWSPAIENNNCDTRH